MFFVRFTVLLAVAGLAQSQTITAGSCSKHIMTKQLFSVERYLGRWYEYEKTPFVFELFGKCVYADYDLLDNGDMSVFNSQLNKITGRPNDIRGTAKVIDSGKLEVRFTGIAALAGPGNYWVLDTDYSSFAVVYSCTDFFSLFNSKVIWILTRERSPTQDTINRARAVVTANGLSLQNFIITDQTNCVERD